MEQHAEIARGDFSHPRAANWSDLVALALVVATILLGSGARQIVALFLATFSTIGKSDTATMRCLPSFLAAKRSASPLPERSPIARRSSWPTNRQHRSIQ
jgi:hypothetical protein